jgi:hypothetical protein
VLLFVFVLRVAESYKEAFAAMQASRKYIKISGHLVLHRQYCVHLIECVPEAFAEVLNLVKSHISSGQLRRNAKVLLSTDVRDAAYTDYSVKIVRASFAPPPLTPRYYIQGLGTHFG